MALAVKFPVRSIVLLLPVMWKSDVTSLKKLNS